MINWEERTNEHRKIIESTVDKNGLKIERGSIVKSGGKEGEVCYIWKFSNSIDALTFKLSEGRSFHYCKRTCPERREGTCVACYPVGNTNCILVSPVGCPECMSCISTCKSEESCSLREEVVK